MQARELHTGSNLALADGDDVAIYDGNRTELSVDIAFQNVIDSVVFIYG